MDVELDREYPILIKQNGIPLSGAYLELMNKQGTTMWSGHSDSTGKAKINILYTHESMLRTYRLCCNEYNLSKEIGFCTSTPIILEKHE